MHELEAADAFDRGEALVDAFESAGEGGLEGAVLGKFGKVAFLAFGPGEAGDELLVGDDQGDQVGALVAIDQDLADFRARGWAMPSTRCGAMLSPPELTIRSRFLSVM